MEKLKTKLGKLEKFKYPLLVLILGLGLMLLPSGGSKTESGSDTDTLLRQTLSCSQGVGEAVVIVSDSGVVVVCQGADKAAVRLDIIRAVSTYTGFGSDKITILKMSKNGS